MIVIVTLYSSTKYFPWLGLSLEALRTFLLGPCERSVVIPLPTAEGESSTTWDDVRIANWILVEDKTHIPCWAPTYWAITTVFLAEVVEKGWKVERCIQYNMVAMTSMPHSPMDLGKSHDAISRTEIILQILKLWGIHSVCNDFSIFQ